MQPLLEFLEAWAYIIFCAYLAYKIGRFLLGYGWKKKTTS